MFGALLPEASASGVARPPAGVRPLPRTALFPAPGRRPAAPSLVAAAAAPAGAPSSTGGSSSGTATPASSSASKPATHAAASTASAPSTSSAAAAADALAAARGPGRGGSSGRALRAGEVVATSSALATSISYRVRPGGGSAGGSGATQKGAVQDFLDKLYLAWRVFFPERPPDLTPKDGAKQRLRMILVADRCGLSPSGLADMKRNILKALEDFVDIESEEEIDISISLEPDLGTIYCVAVPVKRVKPGARLGQDGLVGGDETLLEWDPEDKESNPASRFPMGC